MHLYNWRNILSNNAVVACIPKWHAFHGASRVGRRNLATTKIRLDLFKQAAGATVCERCVLDP